MGFPVKLKLPSIGFTFKPVAPKPKKVVSSHKPLTKILYASARKNEEGNWLAYVNTKGLPDMQDLTILPFTEIPSPISISIFVSDISILSKSFLFFS